MIDESLHDPASATPVVAAAFPTMPRWPGDWPEVADALAATLRDGSWGRYHGPHCDRLVAALSEFHSVPHALLCSSGTAAVELALRGAAVGPGDEVLLAAYDFKANFQNVLTLGATPVLVDITADSWQLDPARLEAAITPASKAIIVSHLHGAAVAMRDVLAVAELRGLTVIEDACQSPGAQIDGQRAGTLGHVGVLSFGGSKLLTAGRGGAILTRDAAIAQRIKLHTQRGNEAYPLSELQAAVLLPQLKRLDERNGIRLRNVLGLLDAIAASALPLRPLIIPAVGTNTTPAFYKLGFEYLAAETGLSRDAVACHLRSQGVAIDPGFAALHRTHSRRRFRTSAELPNADAAHARCLILHHPLLLEDSAVVQAAGGILRRALGAEQEQFPRVLS